MEFSLILSATTSHGMYVLFDVGGIRINIAFCQSLRLWSTSDTPKTCW